MVLEESITCGLEIVKSCSFFVRINCAVLNQNGGIEPGPPHEEGLMVAEQPTAPEDEIKRTGWS
jgi:hypothetical protein